MKIKVTQVGASLITGLVLGLSLQTFWQSSAIANTSGRVAEPTRIRDPYQGQGCPCPYDRAKNNSLCGGRSAYAKLGGNEPVCYVGENSSREKWYYSPETSHVDPRPGR
ncbi:hypothetical protein [Nostoc sp. UHCC 0252]|uniref:hypothetical protein n=1 Tax=Nostoc sp. UHCC 0252 TaxID=3110241 RepID=UPI002B216112|nr:hypothetical protein [Nostoc sp. UHCC 0252]MEA5604998.1 hypothetical protein [Nostoc sp. UHCC 0252]